GPGGRLDLAFGRVLAAVAQARASDAKVALDSLEAIGNVVTDIEKKSGEADPTYRVRPQIMLLEGQGLLAEQQGAVNKAESFLRQAVDMEQTLPVAFGPPTIDKPTHELLGEFLLRQQRYDEAKAEFEKALARTPKRRLAEEGLKQATAGVSRVG
ncbi:MAG: tetratricopeptide repeat protein, partial [Hyphomicrobiales bacterium]